MRTAKEMFETRMCILSLVALCLLLSACGTPATAPSTPVPAATEEPKVEVFLEAPIPENHSTITDGNGNPITAIPTVTNTPVNDNPADKAISVEKLSYEGKVGNVYRFSAAVKNNTENDAYYLAITFNIIDEDGIVIETHTYSATTTVMPGQGVVINGSSTKDISGNYLSVSDFRYEKADKSWVEGLVTMNTDKLKVQ